MIAFLVLCIIAPMSSKQLPRCVVMDSIYIFGISIQDRMLWHGLHLLPSVWVFLHAILTWALQASASFTCLIISCTDLLCHPPTTLLEYTIHWQQCQISPSPVCQASANSTTSHLYQSSSRVSYSIFLVVYKVLTFYVSMIVSLCAIFSRLPSSPVADFPLPTCISVST